jgi:hypothetical protein
MADAQRCAPRAESDAHTTYTLAGSHVIIGVTHADANLLGKLLLSFIGDYDILSSGWLTANDIVRVLAQSSKCQRSKLQRLAQ